MITLSFAEFCRTDWADEGYEMYIVKDTSGAVMYIGISRSSIWSRWFAGNISHMERMPDGSLKGISHIGDAIERRFPESWDWQIELWTLNDCVQSLAREGIQEVYGQNVRHMDIHAFEAYFIQEKKPFYNVAHGGGRNADPLLKRALDEAYDRIFNNPKGEN